MSVMNLLKSLMSYEKYAPTQCQKMYRLKFSAVDDHVIVTVSAATDSEILSQILDDNDDSDDEIVIEDKPPVRPSKMEAENVLETLQNVFLYAIKYGFEMQNLVLHLDKLMDTERKSSSQQKLVRNYFKIV